MRTAHSAAKEIYSNRSRTTPELRPDLRTKLTPAAPIAPDSKRRAWWSQPAPTGDRDDEEEAAMSEDHA